MLERIESALALIDEAEMLSEGKGVAAIIIKQTTSWAKISKQVTDAVRDGRAFKLGRYILTLRGSMYMVDDSLDGRRNIDGISVGKPEYLKVAGRAETVAKSILKAWKADEWAAEK